MTGIRHALVLVAPFVTAVAVLHIAAIAVAELPRATEAAVQTTRSFPGTYEVDWFTLLRNGAPIRSRIVLVLSSDRIPDSLSVRMSLSGGRRTVAVSRACWRLIEGEIPMGYNRPTHTDWTLLPGDTVTTTLWFNVDAGSSLRLWFDSTGMRGEAMSLGYMAINSPQVRSTGGPPVLRDSVRARRLEGPNPQRCLS